MAIELKIPSVGESITEVQIAEWLKPDGAEVKKDENVAVLDSEKTTLELTAPESGRLKITRQAGEMVKIGEVVGEIESGGESAAAKASEEKKPARKAEPETKAVSDLGTKTRPEKVAPKSEKSKQPTVVEAEEAADKMEAPADRAAGNTPVAKEIENKKSAPLTAPAKAPAPAPAPEKPAPKPPAPGA
ncbi:MAG TPA: biotin/lipoyl-containing protein, partial [Verrucomicrobiae bacterium]|nr:biotin/lipoyl-containing protein [Verrucomicrobiae bacterium]